MEPKRELPKDRQNVLISIHTGECKEIPEKNRVSTVTTADSDRVYVSLGTAGTYPGYGPVYRNVPW